MPPNALTTPIIAFSRVRDSLETPPDEPLEDLPAPGIPVVADTVVISKDGSTWFAKSEYGEDKAV
jgi:hypothetical protein